MKKMMTILVTMLLTFSMAYALPSKQEVNTMAQSGNWNGVLDSSNVILQAKPNSALAHYYKSQAQYHLDKYTEAKSELDMAKSLEPSLEFATPQLLNAYETELTRHLTQKTVSPIHQTSTQVISHSNTIQTSNKSEHNGFLTFFIILAVIGLFYFLYRLITSNSNSNSNNMTTNGSAGTRGYNGNPTTDNFNPSNNHPQNPQYAQPVYQQPLYQQPPVVNQGMGVMGTVASVAGGVIVGEAVSHALFDHNGNSNSGYSHTNGGNDTIVNNYYGDNDTQPSNDNTFGFDSGSSDSSFDNDTSSSFDSGSDSSSDSSDNSSDW